MRRSGYRQALWAGLLAVLAASCGAGGSEQGPQGAWRESHDPLEGEFRALGLALQFDPAMASSDISNVEEAILSVSRGHWIGRSSSWFDGVFGGAGPQDALRYLDERVRYLLPADAFPEERLVLRGVDEQEPDQQVAARNIGVLAWLEAELASPRRLEFQFGAESLPLESSRVGIVMLGPAYSGLPAILRAGVLIHEARHSDCTGGLEEEDLKALAEGAEPRSPACGHLHAVCPSWHELSGIAACDDHPWGAYAVEALFLAELARRCVDCSESVRQIAYVEAASAWGRVRGASELLSGRAGNPDMSSSGIRRRSPR